MKIVLGVLLTVLVVGIVTVSNFIGSLGQSTVLPEITVLASNDCTAIGTAGRDIMTGGKGRQVICLKGGADYGHGQNGNDLLKGGSKKDTLIGGNGADSIQGKEGPDQLFGVDREPNDVLKGGKGSDHCYADKGDKVQGCEIVHRGATMAESQSLQNNMGGVMVLAEQQIASPPPTPTPTVTVPPAPSVQPNCTPPPASPPPNC
jgi:RTX calcium-binding nonapeptide repeat (4 copies)